MKKSRRRISHAWAPLSKAIRPPLLADHLKIFCQRAFLMHEFHLSPFLSHIGAEIFATVGPLLAGLRIRMKLRCWVRIRIQMLKLHSKLEKKALQTSTKNDPSRQYSQKFGTVRKDTIITDNFIHSLQEFIILSRSM